MNLMPPYASNATYCQVTGRGLLLCLNSEFESNNRDQEGGYCIHDKMLAILRNIFLLIVLDNVMSCQQNKMSIDRPRNECLSQIEADLLSSSNKSCDLMLG